MAGEIMGAGLGTTSATGDAAAWLDIQGLGALKAGANAQRPDTVRKVAQQFESVFLGMMLKSMRDAKLADSPFESDESRLYQDMFDKQMSLTLSQGKGLGIADMLVRQLQPAGGVTARHASQAVAAYAAPAPVPAPVGRVAGSAPAATAEARAATPFAARTIAALLQGAGPAAPDADAVPGLEAALGGEPAGVAAVDAPAGSLAADGAATPGAATARSRGHHHERFASTPEEFVRKVLPHAQAAAAELGVSPAAIVAQAALETGWGRNVPTGANGAGHNLFGIKAGADWSGERLGRTTLEVERDTAVRTQASFRAYASVSDGFRDYVQLLRNSGRYGGVRAAGGDPARFAHALQASGYATDPHYARKLLQILHGETMRGALAAAGATERDTLLALKSDGTRPIT